MYIFRIFIIIFGDLLGFIDDLIVDDVEVIECLMLMDFGEFELEYRFDEEDL